jgi:flagellar biosynthesis/type III secretory pathway M-ring protein FliF/YscJ
MEGLQEKDKAGWSQSDQAQIYIFSWITLIIILVLLALIIKVIIPRRRIQQPQQ